MWSSRIDFLNNRCFRLWSKGDLLVSLLMCHKMSRTTETTPWKDGYWQTKIPDVPNTELVCIVEKSNVSFKSEETNDVMGTWAFGKFGMASKKLMKMTGISELNIRMTYYVGHLGFGLVFHGVLTKSGTKCYMEYPFEIRKYYRLEEDDIKKLSDFNKLPNLVERRSRLRPVTKLGVTPLPISLPKNIHIKAPTRAVYKYKPPHLSYLCSLILSA